ncbi:MAG: hypothetical protein U9Q27_00815 [Patescibacteria group bacterium]|nr:hypothetical protein [Patescibacteria group bacterium]
MQKRICDVCGKTIDPDLGFYSLATRTKGMITLPNEETDICSIKCLMALVVKLDKRVAKLRETRGEIKTTKFMWESTEVSLDDVEEMEGKFYLTSEAYARYRN